MSESQWDEAARKAAEEIVPEQGYGGDLSEKTAISIIAKHHADLRTTYEKLLWAVYLVDHYIASVRQDFYEEDKDSAWVDLTTAIADPLVQAEIERSKTV